MESGPAVTLLSPAKINLHLRVGPLAASTSGGGFHPLLSWMCTVGLFDKLTFELGGKTSRDGLTAGSCVIDMTCDDPTLSCDETNLVVRALRAVEREAAGMGLAFPTHVRVRLEKRIPMGGGLGGGSSNAATAIRAIDSLAKLNLPADTLGRAAASVGSDVSFFLFGPSAVCTGRGERVTPIASPTVRAVLLMLPGIAMPTPAVYRKFDELKLGEAGSLNEQIDWPAWAKLSAFNLMPLLINDLETPAFALQPDLGQLRTTLQRTLGRTVRMSGSGSSLFTLYDSLEEAQLASESIDAGVCPRVVAAELAPH